MRALILLALVSAAFAASVEFPEDPYSNAQRIIGGSVTTIDKYPDMASLLFSWTGSGHRQSCGGVILNQRSILSAAHCFGSHPNIRWQARLGSTNANSGGVVFAAAQLINHPSYNVAASNDADVAIMRVSGSISYSNVIRPASIAGTNYNVADNSVVWATGWGRTSVNGLQSEQLREVQIWTVNQAICRTRYNTIRLVVTDNMLCSGWLDVGGRDQCQGDSGGPLYHNGVVVGVCSWGQSCALSFFPGVNARVSSYSTWIQNNS